MDSTDSTHSDSDVAVPTGDLDPQAVLAAAGGLLRHLGRSGIRWVPTVEESARQRWLAQMAAPEPPVQRVAEPAASATSPRRPSASPATKSSGTARPSLDAAARSRLMPVPEVTVADSPYPGPMLEADQRRQQLNDLSETVAGCQRCDELAKCRKQTVFGEGNPMARFVFFGEGPGADEDRTGRPFVGRAGQLLTKMIEACHLKREEVYILNSIKCRPPGNRNPTEEEVANCREYFEAQLQWIRPEYIVCLGAVSSKALLRTTLSIGRLRQRFHRYHDSKVLVIYHPAYLLRNPDAKRAAWADLQMLMADAGL